MSLNARSVFGSSSKVNSIYVWPSSAVFRGIFILSWNGMEADDVHFTAASSTAPNAAAVVGAVDDFPSPYTGTYLC